MTDTTQTKRRYDTTGMREAPKNPVYRKEQLFELRRCPLSFAMSCAHSDLDNTHLSGHQEMYNNIAAAESARRYLKEKLTAMHPGMDWHVIETNEPNIIERAMRTARWLRRAIPSVVVSPAFCDGKYVIGADYVVVNEDGSYDVYVCSAKGFMNGRRPTDEASRHTAFEDNAFLMLAVCNKYPKRKLRFHVVGIDGRYKTPYPSKFDGVIHHDVDQMLYIVDIDGNDPALRRTLRRKDTWNLFDWANEIREACEASPDYLPKVPDMDARCNRDFRCPFFMWCQSRKSKDDTTRYLPYRDYRKLKEKFGIKTMPELVGYLENPGSLAQLKLSESAMRELRTYLVLNTANLDADAPSADDGAFHVPADSGEVFIG